MKFSIEDTDLKEVKIIIPHVFEDDRGFFMEVFNKDIFDELGIPSNFVQMNHSRSVKNVIRGLHFQWDPLVGKLMRVTLGNAFVVAVDIRKDSLTFGEWVGYYLSDHNKKQMWAPAEFARGFCVISDVAEVQYLATGTYNHKSEGEILWNDPNIGIHWPTENPILSSKDANAITLKEWSNSKYSNYVR